MTAHYPYLIIGGGLAGASAALGIRSIDPTGEIGMLSREQVAPYDRPPLTKGLWTGRKRPADIFVKEESYYDEHGIALLLGAVAVSVDPEHKLVTTASGTQYGFGKLLIATGATPRRLTIPGGDLDSVCYFRTLEDYEKIRSQAGAGKSALLIGGGFIGSELAAALAMNETRVTMLFPEKHLCHRVFPHDFGEAVDALFAERGIALMTDDAPVSIARNDSGQFSTRTRNGAEIISDMVIAGIGVSPEIELANRAGLNTGDGIIVDEYLQSSAPDIYAAGDNTLFPSRALDRRIRVEHWDNARAQGLQAGRNMAGAQEQYTYMPYFYSDLFELGYEAVGDVRSDCATMADWKERYRTGVIYYLDGRTVRGVMLVNVWEKLARARELVGLAAKIDPAAKHGPIHLP